MKTPANPDVLENCQRPQASPPATLLCRIMASLRAFKCETLKWHDVPDSPYSVLETTGRYWYGYCQHCHRPIITMRHNESSSPTPGVRRRN